MNSREQNRQRIEQALFDGGSPSVEPRAGAAWQSRLMDEIQRLGPLSAASDETEVISPVFGWRMAYAAAACLALLLTSLIVAADMPERAAIETWLNDPAEFTDSGSFNLW